MLSHHRSLKILFQHLSRPPLPSPDSHPMGKFKSAYLPLFNERTERGQRDSVTAIVISNPGRNILWAGKMSVLRGLGCCWNRERKTEMPSTMLCLKFGLDPCASHTLNQRLTASKRCRRASYSSS